jgi:hypothetical protein
MLHVETKEARTVDNGININAPTQRTIDTLAQRGLSKSAAKKEEETKDLPQDLVDIKKPSASKADSAAEAKEGSSDDKEVTVLLYMDGQYPDLESTMANVPIGLEALGSNKDMNIVVQLGRASQADVHPDGGFDRIDSDWEGVRRYFIAPSTEPHSETVTLGDWSDIAKENPDNPLIQFVLGEVYEGQGMKQESEKQFAQAEKLGYMKFFNEPFDPKVKQWSEEFQQVLQPLRDKDAAVNIYHSPVTQDLGPGVDMKHPHNLQDFVAWGMKNYPARHYIVVMGGHGGAWTGALQMSPSDIGMALQAGTNQANRSTGRHDAIDAVALNSCYMGNLESLNEMRNASDVIIASEMSAKSSVLTDWPDLLGKVQMDIKEGNHFDAHDFSKDFVDYYRGRGEAIKDLPLMRKFSKEHYLTCAAVDTGKVENVTEAWKTFVDDWRKSGVSDDAVFKILDGSKNYPSFAYTPEMLFDYGTLRDLGDIADKVAKADKLPQNLKDDAIQIKKALAEAIIAEQHTGHDMENSSGLTIWAPTNVSDIALMAAPYGKRVPDFVQQTNWDRKLVESVNNADQQKLVRFMGSIKMLAQVQQALKTSTLNDQERTSLEQKQKLLQAEAMRLRKDLSLAGNYDKGKESKISTLPAHDEESKAKAVESKPKDEDYIEGTIKTSQSRDGMSHGKGLFLSGTGEDTADADLTLFTDKILSDSQMFDGMGHNPRK